MTMRLQQAYDALENNRQATNKVASNPMSPYQGIAQIAKQYQSTAGQTPTPVPMQSALQQQQAAQQQQQPQPQGFAAGDKVEARSPQVMIDQVINKVVGPGLKAYPDIYAAMQKAVNNMMANGGKMDPRAIQNIIAQVDRHITPQNRAQMMQFESKLRQALSGQGVPLLPVRRADGGDVPTMDVPADDSTIAYAEGDEVQAPEEEPVLPGAVRDLAALYRNDEFSPQEAGIYGLMQQGQMNRGLGDTLAAALTGAANPNPRDRGQEAALMAAKARSNTEGGLTALSNSMVNRAMEAEGSADKNWNKSIGDVFGAMQKTAENQAQLGIHQLDADRVLKRAEMEQAFNSERYKDEERGKNKRAADKLALEEKKISPTAEKKSLTSEAAKGTLARQRAKEVMKEVSNPMSPLFQHAAKLNFDKLYRHFYANPAGSVDDLITTTP